MNELYAVGIFKNGIFTGYATSGRHPTPAVYTTYGRARGEATRRQGQCASGFIEYSVLVLIPK